MKSLLQQRAEALGGRLPLGGPPEEFERVGRLQLEVLIHEGLTFDSKVLDVGCGALRGGYWLIHFLDRGCYFGIEPYEEMLEVGLRHILEPGVRAAKEPRFDENRDFDFTVFGTRFDFVLARSIWTHASMSEVERTLDAFRAVAAPGGAMLTSYFRFPPPLVESPHFFGSIALSRRDLLFERHPRLRELVAERFGLRWAGYEEPMAGGVEQRCLPGKMVVYTRRQIERACAERGLVATELRYGIANSQRWLRIERRQNPT